MYGLTLTDYIISRPDEIESYLNRQDDHTYKSLYQMLYPDKNELVRLKDNDFILWNLCFRIR